MSDVLLELTIQDAILLDLTTEEPINVVTVSDFSLVKGDKGDDSGVTIKATGIDSAGDTGIELPAGYAIIGIVTDNSGTESSQVTFASSENGNDIYSSFILNAGVSCKSLLFVGSMTGATNIYLNVSQEGDLFSGILDIYFLTMKVK